MSIGKHVGLQPHQARAGIDELTAKGQVKAKKRTNGTRDTSLVLRDDVDTEYVPV